MSMFLPVRNVGGIVANAVCDRCRRKMHYTDLAPDGDAPGLRVCDECRDVEDPWRKPARQADKITLQYPRPEDDLV